MNAGPAVSSRLTWQRIFARTDFVTSKTPISRKSRPGSATPFKGSLRDRLVFMLSLLSTSQSAGFPRSAQFGERSREGLRRNAYFHVNSGVRPLSPPAFPLHPD